MLENLRRLRASRPRLNIGAASPLDSATNYPVATPDGQIVGPRVEVTGYRNRVPSHLEQDGEVTESTTEFWPRAKRRRRT